MRFLKCVSIKKAKRTTSTNRLASLCKTGSLARDEPDQSGAGNQRRANSRRAGSTGLKIIQLATAHLGSARRPQAMMGTHFSQSIRSVIKTGPARFSQKSAPVRLKSIRFACRLVAALSQFPLGASAERPVQVSRRRRTRDGRDMSNVALSAADAIMAISNKRAICTKLRCVNIHLIAGDNLAREISIWPS